jgi:hypothetical protein
LGDIIINSSLVPNRQLYGHDLWFSKQLHYLTLQQTVPLPSAFVLHRIAFVEVLEPW